MGFNQLNKKQKIILIIVAIIVMVGIGYYMYVKDNVNVENDKENLEIEQQKIDNNENNVDSNKNDNLNIIVHISGAVNKEGVIELKENSRIADAIEKAGGLKDNACMDEINLAYKLEDGMKIYIPTIEEQKNENIKEESNNYIEKNNIVGDTNTNSNKQSKQTTKVNINKATQTELEALPGIGPSIALKIVNYRKENGKFKSIEDLKQVNGIGDSKFNKIKNLITI